MDKKEKERRKRAAGQGGGYNRINEVSITNACLYFIWMMMSPVHASPSSSSGFIRPSFVPGFHRSLARLFTRSFFRLFVRSFVLLVGHDLAFI